MPLQTLLGIAVDSLDQPDRLALGAIVFLELKEHVRRAISILTLQAVPYTVLRSHFVLFATEEVLLLVYAGLIVWQGNVVVSDKPTRL